jgi:hypothetical protein
MKSSCPEEAVSCRSRVPEFGSTLDSHPAPNRGENGLLHQVASVWTMLSRRTSCFCCSFPCPSQKNKHLYGFVRLTSSSSTSVMHKYYVQLTPFRGVKVHLSQRNKRGQLTSERDNRIKECRMVQPQSGCKFVKERKKKKSRSRCSLPTQKKYALLTVKYSVINLKQVISLEGYLQKKNWL